MEDDNCTKEVQSKDHSTSMKKDENIIEGECTQSIYPLFEQNNQYLIEKTLSSNQKTVTLQNNINETCDHDCHQSMN